MSISSWRPIRHSIDIELTAPVGDGTSYFLRALCFAEEGKDATGDDRELRIRRIEITDVKGPGYTPQGLRQLGELMIEAANYCKDWRPGSLLKPE